MKKVFVNGSFDLLHRGHLELLNYAKSLGDRLYVAIDSDRRISEKKGPSRPVYNVKERKFFLENLKSVDRVYVFDSDIHLESLVNMLKPDIMVVGSDWKNKPVIGSSFASTLIFFDRVRDYSTTKTIQDVVSKNDLCN
jgi:D-beta-D-heptose 7-phosphate kinase/D-beta-D-heptose 1-phosphate adenosyltransferase